MINSLNSLNELSDIYMGSISEEDNSPEAVKARVMQHVRAIRYRARKEGETLNKAYNEFMGSQSGISSTEKQMVKERLGLTGGSAHVGEETSLKDLRRASNLSTSDDPRDQDAAREIKTQMDYEDLLKQRGKKVKKESRVSWRDELREIASDIPVKEKQAEKKVVEKKINNKIEINPTQTQAESFAKELGGELLEMYEVKEEENVDAGEVEDPKARAQEGREKRMKLRLLRLKMQSARQGVPGIVAHYEPEGDVISEKQKDTPDQVKAVIAYDKARKATDDAVYDTEHGKKKQAKKEKDYAKWQRDTGARDAQKSGHPWEHAKGSTREKEGKKSVKHVHVKDSYESQGGVIAEKDLDAAERRALPDKDFALPGKGKGPEGKQAGSYPIPDKSHARMALAMVAKHGTSEEKAKVRAAVEKKFPGIKISEADDKAYKHVVSMLQQKYGKDSVLTKDSPKPKPQPKRKPKPQKPLTPAQKAQLEVDVRYPPETPGTKRNYGD